MIQYKNQGVAGHTFSHMIVEDCGAGEISFEVKNGTKTPLLKHPRNCVLSKTQVKHLYDALGEFLGVTKKAKKNAFIEGEEI